MTAIDRGSSLTRSLASGWLALGVGVAVSFFLSPFVVGKLGAAWYGVWAIAGQFIGYLYLLDFGVRESIIRYTAKYAARQQRRQLNRILTTALALYGGITILTLVAVAVCVWRMPYWIDLEIEYWDDTRWAAAFVGLTITQTFMMNVFNGVVMGLRRWDVANALGIGWNLLRAALIVFLLRRGHGVVALAVVQFAVSFAAGLVTIVIAMSLLRNRQMAFCVVPLRLRRFLALSRRVLSYGFYVIINNVGEKLITSSGAIIVGIYMPIQSVTYFAIAGSLVGYMRSLLGATAQIFNPLASHLHSLRQGAELKTTFLLGVKISILIALPIATAFVLLGKQFIVLWMGPEFGDPSGDVLVALAIAAVLSAPQYILSSVFYGISKHWIVALLRVSEALVNVTLSIVLVQAIGLVGVALGTALPNLVVVLLVLPVLARKIVGVGILEYYVNAYIRPGIAVVPFALGALWVRQTHPAESLLSLFGQIAALTSLFIPCAFALVLNGEERRYVLRRIGMSGRSH